MEGNPKEEELGQKTERFPKINSVQPALVSDLGEVKTILLVRSQQRHLFFAAGVTYLRTYLFPFIKQQTDASALMRSPV